MSVHGSSYPPVGGLRASSLGNFCFVDAFNPGSQYDTRSLHQPFVDAGHNALKRYRVDSDPIPAFPCVVFMGLMKIF